MVAAISATPVLILRLHMEEGSWDRAVEQAKGRESAGEVEILTLDGVVKCTQGKLPNSKVFAPFTELKRLSIANVGLSSLADFPSLPHLERLILSDNRIAGGLEHLVRAGLKSLRELDLSNNKIQSVEDLKPLARLNLESLDLYECPVTRSVDYRAKVFGMMRSLRFLDKTDMTGTERPESDEEEESEEEEDLDDHNGDGVELEGEEDGVECNSKGAVVLDENDEEGEEEDELDDEGDDNDVLEDEDEDDGGSYQEEVLAVASGRGVVQGQVSNDHGSDEEAEDEDTVEVQAIEEACEEDAIGEEDDEDAAIEEGKDEEEPGSGAHVTTEGELDVQENENEDYENGELENEEDDDAVDNDEGEEDVEEEDDDEEEYGTKYLMQPIGQPEEDEGASDFEPGDDGEEDEDFEDEEDGDPVKEPVELTQSRKRSREETDENEDSLAKH